MKIFAALLNLSGRLNWGENDSMWTTEHIIHRCHITLWGRLFFWRWLMSSRTLGEGCSVWWGICICWLALIELGSYVPTENGRSEYCLFWWLHFKGIAPWSLRKMILGCKTRITFQRGRERIYNCNSYEINTLRTGRSGAYRMDYLATLLVKYEQ